MSGRRIRSLCGSLAETHRESGVLFGHDRVRAISRADRLRCDCVSADKRDRERQRERERERKRERPVNPSAPERTTARRRKQEEEDSETWLIGNSVTYLGVMSRR